MTAVPETPVLMMRITSPLFDHVIEIVDRHVIEAWALYFMCCWVPCWANWAMVSAAGLANAGVCHMLTLRPRR